MAAILQKWPYREGVPWNRGCLYPFFLTILIYLSKQQQQQIDLTSAGCSGQHNLPVQIHNPQTTKHQGKKSFTAPDVHSLANQLMLEIPTLTLAYANVLATDAFYIEENMEITYTFAIAKR